MFTFTNVTILLKNNLTIKTGDEYKCVDGNWHVKRQGTDKYEDHNGRNIFDIYLCHYKSFTYVEDESSYKATNWNVDDSGYAANVDIAMSDGKIASIIDVRTNNSSEIRTELTFSNYGSTTLEA